MYLFSPVRPLTQNRQAPTIPPVPLSHQESVLLSDLIPKRHQTHIHTPHGETSNMKKVPSPSIHASRAARCKAYKRRSLAHWLAGWPAGRLPWSVCVNVHAGRQALISRCTATERQAGRHYEKGNSCTCRTCMYYPYVYVHVPVRVRVRMYVHTFVTLLIAVCGWVDGVCVG